MTIFEIIKLEQANTFENIKGDSNINREDFKLLSLNFPYIIFQI